MNLINLFKKKKMIMYKEEDNKFKDEEFEKYQKNFQKEKKLMI